MANPQSTVASRRERRAAERANRGEPRPFRPSLGRGRSGPSLGLISVAAVVAAVGLIAFTAVSQPRSPDTSGLVDPGAPYPTAIRDGRALGRAGAPVTLVVWADFQCPVCARLAEEVEPILVNRYVTSGLLRIEHRDAAILGMGGSGDESLLAAAAARAADEQGAYWTFHDWLFANQDGENRGGFSRERLVAIATAAGLDIARFEASLDGGAGRTAAQAETAAGRATGINGTPTLEIDGQRFVGLQPAAELGAAVEAAAAAKGVTPAPSPAG